MMVSSFEILWIGLLQTLPVICKRVFSEYPQNVAITDSSPLLMNCATGIQNGTAAVFTWKYVPHGQSSEFTISNGREVHRHYDRFRIQECSWNCNLELNQVRMTDAGSYECSIFLSDMNVRSKMSAQLIVLASSPVCSIISHPTGLFEEGDLVHMQCSVTFNGSWAPTMQWEDIDSHQASDFNVWPNSTNTSITSALTFRVNANSNGSRFVCRTFFNRTTRHPTSSGNTPNYLHRWTSPALNLLYGPRDVILSPVSKVYHSDDVIKCSASGNPDPDFIWEDGRGAVISAGPEFIITNDMVGRGLKEIRCLAVNKVGRSNSTFLTFEVKDRGMSSQYWIIICGSVILFCIVWVVLASVILLSRRVALSKQAEIHSKSEKSSLSVIVDPIYADVNKMKTSDTGSNAYNRSMQLLAEVHKPGVSGYSPHRKCKSEDRFSTLSSTDAGESSASGQEFKNPQSCSKSLNESGYFLAKRMDQSYVVGEDGTVYSELNPGRRNEAKNFRGNNLASQLSKEDLYAKIDHTVKFPPPRTPRKQH